jgi:hypothetical protein
VLGVLYLLLATVGLAPMSHTCITETREKIFGLAGFDFEISETNCSTLGEDASMSVFASKAGQPDKVLLFKYGPAGIAPMPVITAIDQQTIQITVPRISDLIFRRENWEGLSVNYSIGVIDHPTSSGAT